MSIRITRRHLAALLFPLAAACAKDERAEALTEAASASAAPEAKPPVTVKLGYQKIGAPFLLKQRSDSLNERLKKHNARAEWIEFKHGPALLEALNANEVDIGYVGETPPVFAQASGVSFVYLASDPPAPKAEAILVPKDSPAKKVEDLRGKKVALNRGSNVHYLLVRALDSVKLTVKDIEVIYLAPPDARAAFETGKVDAWVIWDPFLASAELAGARTLVNGDNLVDNNLFYVARRAFAEGHGEIVADVLAEYQALSEWERTHAEEAAKILSTSSGISYEALLLAEQRHPYGLQPITPEVLAKQQVIADTFRKLELIPKDIRTADAFLPAVNFRAAP